MAVILVLFSIINVKLKEIQKRSLWLLEAGVFFMPDIEHLSISVYIEAKDLQNKAPRQKN